MLHPAQVKAASSSENSFGNWPTVYSLCRPLPVWMPRSRQALAVVPEKRVVRSVTKRTSGKHQVHTRTSALMWCRPRGKTASAADASRFTASSRNGRAASPRAYRRAAMLTMVQNSSGQRS